MAAIATLKVGSFQEVSTSDDDAILVSQASKVVRSFMAMVALRWRRSFVVGENRPEEAQIYRWLILPCSSSITNQWWCGGSSSRPSQLTLYTLLLVRGIAVKHFLPESSRAEL